MLPDEVVTLVRQLLSGVARLHGKFGVGVVAEVLSGASNERSQRWGFEQLSVFGLLRAHPLKRIIAMLHRVMEAGLARQRDPDGVKFRPVMELTASGVRVMKGEQLPPASLADLLPRHRPAAAFSRRITPAASDVDAATALSPEATGRFDRLRSARARIAKERALPAYCICHDATLKAIAKIAPNDAESLEHIKGMGSYKVKLYGQALLDAMHERNTEENAGLATDEDEKDEG